MNGSVKYSVANLHLAALRWSEIRNLEKHGAPVAAHFHFANAEFPLVVVTGAVIFAPFQRPSFDGAFRITHRIAECHAQHAFARVEGEWHLSWRRAASNAVKPARRRRVAGPSVEATGVKRAIIGKPPSHDAGTKRGHR